MIIKEKGKRKNVTLRDFIYSLKIGDKLKYRDICNGLIKGSTVRVAEIKDKNNERYIKVVHENGSWRWINSEWSIQNENDLRGTEIL